MPFSRNLCISDDEISLNKIIHMIDKTMKWPLMTIPTQSQWLSESKKLLILGDAAHAMVPYMSQGEPSRQIFNSSSPRY